MRASDPEVTARLDALYGPCERVTRRKVGQVLLVLKYLGDQNTLEILTGRAMSSVK